MATAVPAERVRLHDPARQHRPLLLHTLAGHLQAQIIEAGEGSQVSAGGSVEHVGAFQMDRVSTSIPEGPGP